MTGLLDELLERVQGLPEEEQENLKNLALESTSDFNWFPNPGPQTDAYFSDADDLFYGGSAGGGKSDLAVGLALNEHTKSLIMRRVRDDCTDLYDRVTEIIGDGHGNKQSFTQALPNKSVRFAGCKNEEDKQRFKGKPYDLYVFDEVGDFLKSQFEFIKTWNRSAKEGQRCRVLATGNPPTNAEGLWVIQYWAAWLDPKHPNPAKEGELRWYTTDADGKEIEVDNAGPHLMVNPKGKFNEKGESVKDSYAGERYDLVRARSRTFIRAWLSDNPFLGEDYEANLDALPAALRAAYRDGRFDLSLEDDIKQVIPTSWIRAAQDRWTRKPPDGIPMDAIGCDVAQGGADNTVLAPRHGGWHAEPIVVPGKETPEGKDVFALIVKHRRNYADMIIDMGGGYGGSVFSYCKELDEKKTHAYKGSEGTPQRDSTKQYGFYNVRSFAYWNMREMLDPDQPGGSSIALPPDDNEMVADLSAPKFEIVRGKNGVPSVKITTKEKLVEDLGRSPDKGDAIIMSHMAGMKPFMRNRKPPVGGYGGSGGERPSSASMGHSAARRSSGRGRR